MFVGKPSVCGCSQLNIDEKYKVLTINTNGKQIVLKEGSWVSINGETGDVLVGKQPLCPASVERSADLVKFMGWVDTKCDMTVLANVDSPADALQVRFLLIILIIVYI